MAVAFVQEFPIVDGDTSTTNYDRVAAEIGNGPFQGLIAHTAGFDHDAGVFRIFDVWESEADLRRFLDGTVQPLVEKLMADNPSATPPQREATYELHHTVR